MDNKRGKREKMGMKLKSRMKKRDERREQKARVVKITEKRWDGFKRKAFTSLSLFC